LIAATALAVGIPVCTRNIDAFRMLDELVDVQAV
jgi:predicted nucleic acid-binding protein